MRKSQLKFLRYVNNLIVNVAPNTNLDPCLTPNNMIQNLQIKFDEIISMITFLRTLTGSNVYTIRKWENPVF